MGRGIRANELVDDRVGSAASFGIVRNKPILQFGIAGDGEAGIDGPESIDDPIGLRIDKRKTIAAREHREAGFGADQMAVGEDAGQ